MPYGYRVGENGALEPVPDQQAVIPRRAGELRAAGKPLRAIQRVLEAERGTRVSLVPCRGFCASAADGRRRAMSVRL